jgi:hypothetical protein
MHVTITQLYHTLAVALAGLLLLAMGVFTFILSSRFTQISREEGTYNRYTSCVLSIPALDRDKKKIEDCWARVQQDTGVEVKRYDK